MDVTEKSKLIQDLQQEFERTLKMKDLKTIIIGDSNGNEKYEVPSETSVKDEKFRQLKGQELLAYAMTKHVDFNYLSKKLKDSDYLEYSKVMMSNQLKMENLECESKYNNADFEYFTKSFANDNVEDEDCVNGESTVNSEVYGATGVSMPNRNSESEDKIAAPYTKEKWEIIKEIYESANCGKPSKNKIALYKAVDAYRLMLMELKLIKQEGKLSEETITHIQGKILFNYSNFVDDISEGGLNNYGERIRCHMKQGIIRVKCDEWKSNVHKIKVDEIKKKCKSGKPFSSILIKPKYFPDNLNMSDNEARDFLMVKIRKSLERLSPKEDVRSSYAPEKIIKNRPTNSSRSCTSHNFETYVQPQQKSGGTSYAAFSDIRAKRKIINQNDVYKELNFSENIKINTTDITNKYVDKRRKVADNGTSSSHSEENPYPMFKTANDLMDNQKNKPLSNRKRLGNKGSVSSKFISPLHKKDETDEDKNIQKENTDEVQDERLKGIDPKIVEIMLSEIMDNSNPISWDDIAGLEDVKATLTEIVVWPLLRPDIFTGLRGPPKGIMLFGPPGTGKTLIGKCVASQSKSTFFSISASSLSSKWYGEGEKLVRALFTVARCYQPAVIFIDEIDSLLIQRSEGEHEASRRVKTEFLVQLDGVRTLSDERLLVIGATNRPQELDEAARRRLVKRLYIPLPGPEARIQIVKTLLKDQYHKLSEEDYELLKEKTAGYSGADMTNLCKEAALGPIRSTNIFDITTLSKDDVPPIQITDFINALKQVRASVSDADLSVYEEWNRKYGSMF